ncbi:MAG TPA: DUF2844 domain-containing protein [Candidatus Cybelea sp.]|nr:DUF2844 domain-containing protein [Candidatus Cybelea sp.]
MKFRLALLRGAWVLPLAVACLVVSTAATLGKPEGEIAKVASGLKLKKVETQSSHGYSVAILSSHDLTVKEYINPKTKLVFGVTWNGTRMPDPQLLLGFDPATLQGKAAYRPLHHSIVKTSTVLLEMGGRMGLYAGRAIRTDLLPAGVKPLEVAP